jgi:hypothetical protein
LPSKLEGLFKTLTWADFGKKSLTPSPGQTIHLAQTAVTIAPSLPNPTIVPVPGSKPTVYQLSDKVVVKIVFDKSNSWVADWVFTQSTTFQNDLLNHEQGHYNLVALIARDLFVDIMLLKGQTFASASAGIAAIKPLLAPFQANPHISQKVADKYDSSAQTNNGTDKTAQAKWDGFIKKAFTDPRTPASSSPDGKTHKVRIVDVLKAAGINP